jgi:uncharacterized membrane protein
VEIEMVARQVRPDRLSAFSDAMFAVIITILPLDLRPPHSASLSARRPWWRLVAFRSQPN